MTAENGSFLEQYFEPFRNKIIGNEEYFNSPMGLRRILYADWTASGRLYKGIEEKMLTDFGPYVGNTHTETSITGTSMTMAYQMAREIIKKHVNAAATDCLIAFGSGMTGVVNKLQRILGLKVPEQWKQAIHLNDNEKAVVFVTHMEHHSNHTSWLETLAHVECIAPTADGLVDLNHLQYLLENYKHVPTKIAAITACSNVTGIQTPYHEVASLMHRYEGFCFVDFACSAPYVQINMHPSDPFQKLDAIYFSPHKFLGGPGTPGILIFDRELYHNHVPDHPGGGTVKWTNPWKEHEYIDNVEDREDGGTPPFLQTIKAALCVRLKEEMNMEHIISREKEILTILFGHLEKISNLHILEGNIRQRLGVMSFYIDGLHYNLGVKLLNDRFGIQARGGCSCAGTYGHYLLNVSPNTSRAITCEIHKGNLSTKPGWIRISVHPVMSNAEIFFICNALQELAAHHAVWGNEYGYDACRNEFTHNRYRGEDFNKIKNWFHHIS